MKFLEFLFNFTFPKFIQSTINKLYINYFKIDMSEFDEASSYKSLNELFTRKLKIQRKVEEGFISPCDGTILQSGTSFKNEHNEHFGLSVKNYTYSITSLLEQSIKEDLNYVNIYLAPSNYHRFHCPCDMKILEVKFAGKALFSVNQKHLEKIPNLYNQNKRVILKCQSDEGFVFYMVFIGAINVGKIIFNFTNHENIHFKKAQELGRFELGSSIVLLSQKGVLTYKKEGVIKFGQSLVL